MNDDERKKKSESHLEKGKRPVIYLFSSILGLELIPADPEKGSQSITSVRQTAGAPELLAVEEL